ncbi:MAG: tetratricopeptide repeat protein [Pyrinomonadaceae bacterium]
MKRCPQCGRDYNDDSLSFCLDDGSELLFGPSSSDEPATAILSEPPASAGNPFSESATRAQIHTTASEGEGPGSLGNSPGKQRTSANRTIKPLAILIAAVLVIAAVFFGYRYFSSPALRQIESIAVMPFVNESGNSDAEYLSDGMTESLINSLSRLPKLAVKARSSVFHYKGKDMLPQQIGDELNVQAVLSGRVIQRSSDLTLYLSLIDARTGNQIWGEQYNRKHADLVSLQSEIARDVSQMLRVHLSGAEEQKLAKNYTKNAEAYQEFLKGRYFSGKSTEDGLKKSVEHFQRAIELDPNYALAYAGLANAYWYASDLQFAPRDVMPKAKAAALKAIEIDESLAEAHAGLGIFKTAYDWDWTGAEKDFRRAIELNPDDSTPHQFYGWYLALMGRHDESFAEMNRAQQSDPLSLNVNAGSGRALYWARRYNDAQRQLQKTLELDPNFWLTRTYLSEVYLEMGKYTEALAEILKARQIEENHYVLARLGLVYARMGRRGDALQVISELKELSKRSYVSAHSIAVIYAGLGERDAAFEWLEKAFDERAESIGWLKVDPRIDSLRDDARYKDLLKRMSFPE